MKFTELYQTVTGHLYDFMIPVCALYVLRLAVCFAELGHMRRLREKKSAYHGVTKHYAEIGCMAFMLALGVLTCLLPRVWPAPFVLMLAAGVIGWRIGKRRGEKMDEHWRAEAERLRQNGVSAAAVDTGYNGLLDTLDVYDKTVSAPPQAGAAAAAKQEENKEER